MAIMSISNQKIVKSLEDTTRQYLVGDLNKPQKLNYIKDNKLEIGISSYSKFGLEPPHTHSQAYEYQYMISGFTTYLDLDTHQEISFHKGDFFVITPGVRYAQKSKPDTSILFIKVPPGNDKIIIELDKIVSEWLSKNIETTRIDYTNRDDAPPANSIKPAVATVLFNDKDEILILKRRDSGNWTLPGGTHQFGESLNDCARRETKEETGYEIEVTDIIGTYSNPKTVVAYSDGEVRQEFTIVFKAKIVSGAIKIDDESTDCRWEKIHNILKLPLADSQKIRIQDVIEYKKRGVRFVR